MVTEYPTAQDLRAALAFRVHHFCRLTGMSRTAIGMGALKDSDAVPRVLNEDSNFTIRTYSRLMTWLDDNWPGRRRKPSAKTQE